MNFKINRLKNTIPCEDTVFPDMPWLKIGHIGDTDVFSANEVLRNTGSSLDLHTFMNVYKREISIIADSTQTQLGDLFFVTKDNHVYINKVLMITFIMCTSPQMYAYFNNLLDDVLTSGIAYSDTYIMSMAANRIPSEYLHRIIEMRNGGNDKET